jgi:hypothetical protein
VSADDDDTAVVVSWLVSSVVPFDELLPVAEIDVVGPLVPSVPGVVELPVSDALPDPNGSPSSPPGHPPMHTPITAVANPCHALICQTPDFAMVAQNESQSAAASYIRM